MGVEYVYRNVKIPKLAKVQREFLVNPVVDIAGTINKTMNDSNIASKLKKNSKVAIGVGSRGIANLSLITKTVVDWFREQGADPFIFPAMGSHGGGTNEGQIVQLASVGVTEESAGCPILSDMDAVLVGEYQTKADGIKVNAYFDPHAYKADAVFYLSRIKPHPQFTAKHESGLCKMLTIGCGKHLCAEACHSLGFEYFPDIIVGMSQVLLEKMPNIVGALAIVENALHGTELLECVPSEKLFERDAEILLLAKKCLPDLPLRQMHALIVDYMGKNIAGTGMDPNITGRYFSPRQTDIKMAGLSVLNLTKEAYGNSNGIGAADFITQRLFDGIDFEKTYLNGLADPMLNTNIKIPPIMPNDYGAICMALLKGNPKNEDPVVCRIKNTLSLSKFLVSEAALEQMLEKPGFTLIEKAKPLEFDADGNLADKYEVWNTF